MNSQDKLIKKVFNSSSRTAKNILGGSFHDLHALAGNKIKQLEEEAQKLRKENFWVDELIEQANGKDEQIKMLKRDIEKVMEIYADF